ncbi:MAG: SDR family NAD(P)-dependent oxidoreductase [Acetatifactor sp.]|nr:SDR family NAD(P)-dependent oxidoreductase [Acetatifactor sp.]
MRLLTILKKTIRFMKRKEYIPVVTQKNDSEIFRGKVALVVGGSGGIGAAVAKKLVAQGCKVVITGTNEEKLNKICKSINSTNDVRIRYISLDLLDIDSMKKKIDEVPSLFEENRVDILVNSAGVYSDASFMSITESEYDRVMDINLKGLYFVCKYVSEIMIKQGIKGHILNVSSASSLRPAINPYGISKWGVRGFTVGLANELIKKGIVVNAIGPGPVATAMNGRGEGDTIAHPSNPSGRCATTEEIAELVCYMVSGRADMVVGDTFYISGGGGITSLHC